MTGGVSSGAISNLLPGPIQHWRVSSPKAPRTQAFEFLSAKDGSVVPAVRGRDGTTPLHSLVDPVKEARRVYETIRGAGYIACLGLGAGFIPAVFLEDPVPTDLLIVEKDPRTLRGLFENISFVPLLSDRRVHVIAGLDEMRSTVSSTYLPAIAQDLRSLPLRPWCDREPEFFARAVAELLAAVEDVRSDFSVQAHFGRRWFVNMTLNIAGAGKASTPLPGGDEAHVTAAGPSLEPHLSAIAGRRHGSILIATDTSLPALLKNGIRPDAVVSMDCQQHSFHHFLAGMPADACFFFDLASPPFLARRAAGQSRFFASGHPFARLAAAQCGPFPRIDTTGGNVTHAAVSLAAALGARTIHIHGADFSYPDGKPYARGTYLYDYFGNRQLRWLPLEGSLFDFIHRSSRLSREMVSGTARYTTPVLLDYRDRLERLSSTLNARLMASEGRGLPLQLERLPGGPPASGNTELWDDASSARSCLDFLREYRQQLAALPGPAAPVGRWLSGLTVDQRGLWATVLPITAALLREEPECRDRALPLQRSRQWALDRLDLLLGAGIQG